MIDFQTAISLLILLPMMAAGLCRILSKSIFRNLLILISCTLMVIGVFGLLLHPPVTVNLGEAETEILNHAITGLDFLLLSLFMYFGWRNQSLKVILLSALQFIFLLYFEILAGKDGVSNAAIINCDGLSLIMLLVVSGVGTFICIHAIPLYGQP